jgi:hypothetical protein
MAGDREAQFRAVAAIAEAVRIAGEIPAGHLYAMVLDRMPLAVFEEIVALLVRAKLVRRESSHLLVWIGQLKGVTK